MLLDQSKYGAGLNYFYASRHGVDAAQGVYDEYQEYQESNLLTRSGKFLAARTALHGFNRLTGREKGPLKSVGALFNHGFAKTGKLGFNSAGASLSYLAMGANWDPEGSVLGNVAGMAVGHGLMMGASGIATSKRAKTMVKSFSRRIDKANSGKTLNSIKRKQRSNRVKSRLDSDYGLTKGEGFTMRNTDGFNSTRYSPLGSKTTIINKQKFAAGMVNGATYTGTDYSTPIGPTRTAPSTAPKVDTGRRTSRRKTYTQPEKPIAGFTSPTAYVDRSPTKFSQRLQSAYQGTKTATKNISKSILGSGSKALSYTGRTLLPGVGIAAGVTAIGIGAGFKAFHRVSTAVQNAKPMDFGSGFTGMNGEAVNERQRALQAMANSNLNVRSLLGQEAHSFRY